MKKKLKEVNSFEQLQEDLWKQPWKKGFSNDLVSLRAVLPCLRGFEHLKDLLKSLAKAGNRNE